MPRVHGRRARGGHDVRANATTAGACQGRRLHLEPLEDRRLLSGSPWQNPTLPYDVNNNGSVTTSDALAVISRLLSVGRGPLPTPDAEHPVNAYYDTNGDGYLSTNDALRVISAILHPPAVTLATSSPLSIDLTPQLTVTATGGSGVPANATVHVDVDLNDDGDYADPGETDYMQATMSGGKAIFDLAPALAPDGPDGTYTVKLRAHVVDNNGVSGFSQPQSLLIDTQMSDVLQTYAHAPDDAYGYSLSRTIDGPNRAYTVYDINMTSQTWRSPSEVDRTTWQHWVQIVVPSGTVSSTALLLIDGGSNGGSAPDPNSGVVAAAMQSHSVAIDLQDVPNEPLTFSGDPNDPREEDEIIAYSFDQFMQHLGQSGDETWPVLMAMVKSAVRAMDTAQAFVPTVSNGAQINDFVVTGYSKRGWTTWLTAAADDRVKAIIPGVFDNLNIADEMVHHYGVYGFFSPAIQAYNDLHIFDRILTPAGQALSQIVDPYRYLSEPQMTMPKLMIDSTGDQFFVSDSAQYYIHDLPGTQNYIRYLPNTGHGLDDRAQASTESFYDALLNNTPLPQFTWTIQPDGGIRVQTSTPATQVLLWQATNPTARDFRQLYTNVVWTSSILFDEGGGVYTGDPPMPDSGARAYMVELTFPSGDLGNPFVFTTEIHVKTNLPLYPWPFASSLDTGSASASPLMNALTAGLTTQGAMVAEGGSTAPAANPIPPEPPSPDVASSASAVADWSSADSLDGIASPSQDSPATEAVFAELSDDDPFDQSLSA